MVHISKKSKTCQIDWWRVAGGVYALVASTNLLFVLSILADPLKRAAVLFTLANASNMLVSLVGILLPLVELSVVILIPYLFFKRSEWAIKLTFIVYIFEGVLKVILGLKTGSIVHIVGGSFFAFISSFFIYMIKHHKQPHTTPTTKHKKS